MPKEQKSIRLDANLISYIRTVYQEGSLYGYNDICYTPQWFREIIDYWYAWYHGYYEEFHQYNYYNGTKYIKAYYNSLMAAKKVCEDRADNLLNEKVTITTENEKDTEFIKNVLEGNLFRERANELVERTNALGTGAFIEFLDTDDVDNATAKDINIDYITAEGIIPITVINNEIIDAAFVSEKTYKEKQVAYVNSHILLHALNADSDESAKQARINNGIPLDYEGYIVENMILERRGSGEYVREKTDLVDFYLTNTTTPYFQIIRPANANNYCRDIGMGISCFANAISALESVDKAFDAFSSEPSIGKMRIFVNDDLAQIDVDTTGTETILRPRFDPRDTTYYALDMTGTEKAIIHINPELRIDDLEKAVNKNLNLVGLLCGLGNNYYKFESGQIKTATEVISDNHPLAKRNKKDNEILSRALKGLGKAILSFGARIGAVTDEEQNIIVTLDDGIIEDTDALVKRALLELSTGVISKVEYRMRIYKESEEDARAALALIENADDGDDLDEDI